MNKLQIKDSETCSYQNQWDADKTHTEENIIYIENRKD